MSFISYLSTNDILFIKLKAVVKGLHFRSIRLEKNQLKWKLEKIADTKRVIRSHQSMKDRQNRNLKD